MLTVWDWQREGMGITNRAGKGVEINLVAGLPQSAVLQYAYANEYLMEYSSTTATDLLLKEIRNIQQVKIIDVGQVMGFITHQLFKK